MDTPYFRTLIARGRRVPLWAWEVSILTVMAPPLLHAVAFLGQLPVA
jgi:hypothetical protein